MNSIKEYHLLTGVILVVGILFVIWSFSAVSSLLASEASFINVLESALK